MPTATPPAATLSTRSPDRRRAFVRLFAAFLCTALASSAEAEERLEYNRDIRPILMDTCFACHGPDSAARQADLRLDQREVAVDFGAIVPEDADGSEMMRRILSEDPDERMPPPETKKTLTPEQIETLKQWIDEGAEYQLHWSFIPPERPAIPEVAAVIDDAPVELPAPEALARWPRNPIDHFVLARMLRNGLTPAQEADRRRLARRVSLDLTGLPPDPALLEAYLQDEAPGAYERLVDQLLDSRAWGEHRARYWLDYARYADTHGLHFDNYREMWSYRDWVIRAFNRNMPFDQFTIENLAGDLLPNAGLDERTASGFNRCNITTNEGGIIDEEYLVLYTRDRIETTAQVWLGLTAGCAVCHSHKFDPLSQQEFYALAAFFNNTTQGARDGNVQNTPPIINVPLPEDRDRWEALPALITDSRRRLDQRRVSARETFEAWLTEAGPDALDGTVPTDTYLHAPLDEGEGEHTRIVVDNRPQDVTLRESASWTDSGGEVALDDGTGLNVQGVAAELSDAGDFEWDEPFSCSAWVRLPASDGHGALFARMDNGNAFRGWDFWMQQRRIGMHVISKWPERGLKVVAKNQVPANEWVHVAVSYDGSGKAAGVKVYYNGEPQEVNVENDRLQGSIRTEVSWFIGQRSTNEPLTGTLRDLRIYRRVLPPAEVAALSRHRRFADILAAPAEERSPEQVDELYAFWLGAFDEPFQNVSTELAQLEREKNTIEARGTIAHVMQERDAPPTAFVLYRGEYDQRREEVGADTPAVLPPFPDDLPRNRLGFAQWLLLPEHPLTARVTVNRYWQEIFGSGLVRTTGDFGVAGELPSHPELLDWLALEFQESGWDVKGLFKLIVMSSTYRQAAVTTPIKLERDPQNRLLSRGSRFRMDGEMVRDYALAASGLLVPEIGGPSVKPYQPPGVWEAIAMNVSNTRSYEPGSGSDLYRRSMYTFIKRMAPPASMEIFNAPNREFCTVRRERTNTALQALVTLNDEQFVEAARHLAQHALRHDDPSFEARLSVLSRRLIARDFSIAERAIVRDSLDQLLAYYREHPDDARSLLQVGESAADPTLNPEELAAWTMLANELFNLDEVLCK